MLNYRYLVLHVPDISQVDDKVRDVRKRKFTLFRMLDCERYYCLIFRKIV